MSDVNQFQVMNMLKKIPAETLGSKAKLILLVLSSYSNCKSIYVSAKRLAKEASVSESTALRALKDLETKGVVNIKTIRCAGLFLRHKTINMDVLKSLSAPKKVDYVMSLEDLDL